LAAQGFDVFLPTLGVWSRRGGARHTINMPMFPGYLFLRHAMDKSSYVQVLKARGVVRVLGERWDRLTPLPETEIQTVKSVISAGLSVMAHPFLRLGQRVRVTRGPLGDVEGILVRTRPEKGLLVLSVDLLRQSVAVVIDSLDVTPA
jgi:transcription antitermination factor NusG